MKTLVIGLGNPILGDDGVGWHVAEAVARLTSERPEVEVDCVSLGGLSLMERLTGATRVILVDAIFTGNAPVGTVRQLTLGDLPDLTTGHSASVHDTSLHNALSVGRSMDIALPDDTQIELFSFPNPPARLTRPEARGLRHLAFAVKDLDQEIARLSALGVVIESVRTDDATGRRYTFFADPDGLPLELYESPRAAQTT